MKLIISAALFLLYATIVYAELQVWQIIDITCINLVFTLATYLSIEIETKFWHCSFA